MPAPTNYRTPNYNLSWGSTTFREAMSQDTPTPDENFSRDGNNRTTRRFYCNWTRRQQAVYDLLGWTTRQLTGSTVWLNRNTPYPHNSYLGLMYADRMNIKGDRPLSTITGGVSYDAAGVGAWDEACLSIEFNAPMFQVVTDANMVAFGYISGGVPDEATLCRYVEVRYQPVAKYQTLPPFKTLVWTSGAASTGRPVSTVVAIPLFEADIEILQREFPIGAIPFANIQNAIGSTNSAALGSAGAIIGPGVPNLQFPTGTLIYGQPKYDFYRQVTGDFVANICHRMRYYPQGANKFYSALTSGGVPDGFQSVAYNGGTTPLFPTTNYALVFRPV
jgi:hypothetical protein